MKKMFCVLFGILLLVSSVIQAQVLEAENVQELSKDARKGELVNFWYNPEARDFVLIFAREKGKNVINEVYQFDYDLKLTNQETLEQSAIRDKYPDAVVVETAPSGTWNNPKVVRTDPAITGQIVLAQGTLTREWAKMVEDKGNYRYTTHYWKYNFEEQQRVTPKFEGIFQLPEGAPALVVKMAKKAAEKIVQLAVSTDEPTADVTTGRQNFVYPSLWTRTRDYAGASGDILIVGRSDQMDYKTKEPKQVFVLLQYSAEDLSQKHYETFELEFLQDVAFKQVLPDGSMVLVFAPIGGPGVKGKSPNPSAYFYVRVGKDATLMEKIPFESKGGLWVIQNAVLNNNNEVILYGAAVEKKKDKYFNMAGGVVQGSCDNIQIMKIANGAVSYLTSVNLKDLEGKVKKPGNQKKAESYAGKDFTMSNSCTQTTSGDFLFSGQTADHSALHIFQFGANGDFKGQYVINTEKQVKETPIDYTLFENPDKQTVTIYLAELTGVDKGRQLKYPRLATINVGNISVSEIMSCGFGKKGEFFLDDMYPTTLIDDGAKVVFFSRDAKDANIWLGRVKLGN
ncbi:MAG: hypothetical protein WC957_07350 [Candidatus Neomarinimicrobiota bacterium]|jgi:hypothetical protein